MDLQRKVPAMAHLLVLEDDGLIALMLAEWLEEMGHSVTTTTTIEGALQALAVHQFDAALVDFRIGAATSQAVLDELEARAFPYAIASGGPPHPNRLLLAKPYDFNQCKVVVTELLKAAP